MRLSRVLTLFVAAAPFLSPAIAQDAPPQRVRGVIETVHGSTLAIKTRDGQEVKLRLKDGARIVALVKASAADIHSGDFVGAAAEPQPDGTQAAIEVHIFPESARGAGAGFRSFDLTPTSTMTNGAVGERVEATDGPKLTLTYPGGQQTVVVTDKTVVVTMAPGAAADLKPGAGVIAFGAKPGGDGVLEAAAITVGRDVQPPM
jgi:hypothetical protein